MLSVDVTATRGEFELAAAFTVARGEVVAIMGPNGSGKSTLLECIAGLHPAAGTVEVDGRMLSGPSGIVPPARRRVGLLAQEPLLFPHLTALENVAFGPRTRLSRADAVEVARASLAELALGGVGARRPGELSGGQQQRVAIARALAADPLVLLLDEPMTAIDVDHARLVRDRLRARADDRATLLVTHDVGDALALADRVILLEHGRIVREGPAREVLATLGAGVSVTATVGDSGEVGLPEGVELAPGQRVTVTVLAPHAARGSDEDGPRAVPDLG